MKKICLINSIAILILLLFSTIIFAYFTLVETTSDIIIETGDLEQEVSINGTVVTEDSVEIKTNIIFFDLLVDLKENNADLIYNSSVIELDVEIVNKGTIAFNLTIDLIKGCSNNANSVLLTYLLVESDTTNYYTYLTTLINGLTTADAIRTKIDETNETFIDNFTSLAPNEKVDFKIVVFGYQHDASKKNSEFMNDDYSIQFKATARQEEVGVE